jgi:hypothetical protein
MLMSRIQACERTLEKGEGVRSQEERDKAWAGDPGNMEFVIPSKSADSDDEVSCGWRSGGWWGRRAGDI